MGRNRLEGVLRYVCTLQFNQKYNKKEFDRMSGKLRVLSLFSGIGSFERGLERSGL